MQPMVLWALWQALFEPFAGAFTPRGFPRFVQWVTRTGRKTRFRLLASSTGWDWIPTGFLRKVSDHSSPFPRLSWRKR